MATRINKENPGTLKVCQLVPGREYAMHCDPSVTVRVDTVVKPRGPWAHAHISYVITRRNAPMTVRCAAYTGTLIPKPEHGQLALF